MRFAPLSFVWTPERLRLAGLDGAGPKRPELPRPSRPAGYGLAGAALAWTQHRTAEHAARRVAGRNAWTAFWF